MGEDDNMEVEIIEKIFFLIWTMFVKLIFANTRA